MAPDDAGAKFVRTIGRSLVPSRDRGRAPTKAVVEAQGNHVHVLSNPVVDDACKARIDPGEGIVRISHPQMVVFSTDRPVRREAVLKADAEGAAPACRTSRGQTRQGDRVEYIKVIAGYTTCVLPID